VRRPTIGLKRKQWEPFAFASLSLFLIGLVIVFPLVYAFHLSLRNFELSVGPEHDCRRFVESVWNTVVIIVPSLIAELLLGLGIALLLNRVIRGRPLVTALLAIPAMVSPVMAAMAWRMMFGVKYGAINNLGRQVGLLDVYNRLVRHALPVDRHHRAGRGLAQHALHDAGAAGRPAVDSPGAVRARARGRRQRLAELLVDHPAAAQVHDGGRDHDPHDRRPASGSATRTSRSLWARPASGSSPAPRSTARSCTPVADARLLDGGLDLFSHPDQSLKIVMDPKTIMDPWRVSHFRAEAFRKALPDADKYLKAIEDSSPHTVPDPVIPGANEYQGKLSFEITEALAKRKSPKEALDSAAAEWEKITDRRGRDKQKAQWGERLHEMKQVGIEYQPDWAAKAK
jgi:hypothetical protein